MKRPDLEMIRVINKRSKFVDLSDALNLPFFHLSYKNIADFEFAVADEHKESRTLVKLRNGGQRTRHYIKGIEWVYDRLVLTGRDNVLLDYAEGTYDPDDEKIVKYWGIIEPGEERDYIYLAYQYAEENSLFEWKGYYERSGIKDDVHPESSHIEPCEDPEYEELMRAQVDLYQAMDLTQVDYDGYMKGIRQHVSAFYRFACGLMSHLKYGDKHAVEVTPSKTPKINPVLKRDRPWVGASGPQVLLLDRMPATQSEGTGTHASPKPHRRRGHWKTLSHPRFRHHPQYQKKIYVKPSFVGPRQVSYEGNIYRLVETLENAL